MGDGQVNVSPCRIIAPFENKNQLDLKSQKTLDEEREDQERSTREEDEERTEADRAIPEQETGKATEKPQ